jgi:hypothetical protein
MSGYSGRARASGVPDNFLKPGALQRPRFAFYFQSLDQAVAPIGADYVWLVSRARLKRVPFPSHPSYWSFAYSALACFNTGRSGSAFFQRPKKSSVHRRRSLAENPAGLRCSSGMKCTAFSRSLAWSFSSKALVRFCVCSERRERFPETTHRVAYAMAKFGSNSVARWKCGTACSSFNL